MSLPEPLQLHRSRAPTTPRDRVKAMLNEGVKVSKIAIESGVKPAEIKGWLDADVVPLEVEIRLLAWLDDLDQRTAELDELPFVEWSMTRQTEAVLEKCRDPNHPCIGVVDGPPGTGKTTIACRVAEKNRNTFYFAATHFVRTPTATLHMIAESIGNKTGERSLGLGAYRGYALLQAIKDRLGPGSLLICDEANHLDVASLDAIRYFYDEARCGVCYLGNEALASRLRGAGRRAEFAQISSRIACKLHLTAPDEADIDEILGSWGISGSAERRFLHQIAVGPGGLRILGHVVREARMLAREMKRPVDAQVLQGAASLVGID